MASENYLVLEGQKLGQIKGSVTKKPHEGKIRVLAVTHEISGGVTAGRSPKVKTVHKPLSLIKEPDRSTVLLHQVLGDGQLFGHWELQTWTPDPMAAGQLKQESTIRLTNARLIGFEMLYIVDPKTNAFLPYEKILFSYELIEWTWEDGGIIAQDTW